MTRPASSTSPKHFCSVSSARASSDGPLPWGWNSPAAYQLGFWALPYSSFPTTRLVSCSDSVPLGIPWMQMFAVTRMQPLAPRAVYLTEARLGGQASKGPSVPVAVGASGPRARNLEMLAFYEVRRFLGQGVVAGFWRPGAPGSPGYRFVCRHTHTHTHASLAQVSIAFPRFSNVSVTSEFEEPLV